jgi:hypothetical protein
MTGDEISKLQEIFKKKFLDLERTPQEMWEHGSRERAWDEILEALGIEKMSMLMHMITTPQDGEFRIHEPNTGRILKIPRETALKILVLGLY